MEYAPTKTLNTNTAETNIVLADPLRVSIVEALQHGEMSLAELAEMLHVSERLMRYQLRLLMRSGAVDENQTGYHITYVVSNPRIASACHVLYELWAEEARRSRSRPAVAL